MDSEERFAKLRELLSRSLNHRIMHQLIHILRQWPENEDQLLARQYIEAHVAQWGYSLEEMMEENEQDESPVFESVRKQVSRQTKGEQRRMERRDSPYKGHKSPGHAKKKP